MTVLLASDLDRTLIYSRNALRLGPVPADLTTVETADGEEVSFMTARAAELLVQLAQTATVLPVTTRTPAQLSRVRLPGASRYAVAANGGVLLIDGLADHDWRRLVSAQLRQVTPLAEVSAHLARVCQPAWTVKLRQAESMFCFAVVDRERLPDGFVGELTHWAAQRGWLTSLQGRKLYCVPTVLTKSAAVTEVARRIGADAVFAAGDSLLDLDLLGAADAGIHPAHGEIADSGWSAAHVVTTETAGVLAGEEICRWFTAVLTARVNCHRADSIVG